MKEYIEFKEFKKCVPGNYPIGWNNLVQDIYGYVKKWNETNDTKMVICKVTILNEELFICVEDLEYKQPSYNSLQVMVDSFCTRSNFICKICGKEKEEIVVDSNLEYRCLDHYSDIN